MHWEFNDIGHRPFPIPNNPWVMTQVWNDVLFAHWPVDEELISPLLPYGLEVDLFNGTAWISIVSFQITNFRLRLLPSIPSFSSFPQVNVRTYVTNGGIPGVYFFYLDAPLLSVVFGARWMTGLPYRHAKMTYHFVNNNGINFSSRLEASRVTENWQVIYKPTNSYMYEVSRTSLDFWLLERYRLYSLKGAMLYYIDIHHDQWTLSTVQAAIMENSIASFLPRAAFREQPIFHYSKRQQCFIFPLKSC